MARPALPPPRTPASGSRRIAVVLPALLLGLVVLLVSMAPTASAATPAPTGLRVVGTTGTSVKLSWNVVKGAPKYRIQYATSASMAGATYQRFTSTSAEISGLKPDTRYYVKVRVITAAGGNLSSYSPAVVATTPAGFSSPTGLKVVRSTSTSLQLSWNAVTGAPKYRIQYATSASMAGATYLRFTSASAEISGLKANTRYYVKVRVITADGGNLSAYSSAVEARTDAQWALAAPPSGSTLRVGSFNLKCFNCVGHQPNERTWYQRRGDVVSTIEDQHLDVLGVQEASQGWLKDRDGGRTVELSQFEDLRNRLAGTWELANANRNNCVKATTPTRCAAKDQGASKGTKILYDRSRVDLFDNGSELLASLSPSAERYVAWAVFRQRSTGKKFFFADAHLEPNKDWALHVKQATQVAEEIKKQNTGKLPVFVVGDLNSHKNTLPSNGVYDVIVDKYGYVDPLGNRRGSTTATPGATAEKRINTWLNSYNDFLRTPDPLYYGRRPNGTYIDYIFTSQKVRVTEWETVANLDAAHNYAGRQASDHNLIRASVILP